MLYAKLENGVPVFLTQPVELGGRKFYTSDPAVLKMAGWKRFINDCPPDEAGEVEYVETETELIRRKKVTEND